LKRISDMQAAASAVVAADYVNRVWVDRGWSRACVVARAWKAAESGELAADPATVPDDVCIGAGIADAAARWPSEGTREVSEGDGSLVGLPVPDQLPEPEASLVDPDQVQARASASRHRPGRENAKTQDRDDSETHTLTCSGYPPKEQTRRRPL